MSITRRDFLNGVALTIGSALTPLHQLKAQNIFLSQSSYYPPTLTGMRGSHPGSFETAHKLGREGKKFDTDSLSISEKYDYVIVGAGLSGLAAAFSIREKKPKATILILDNHDDFGGHAKRNEFDIEGRTLISYGGSESLQSPNSLYSKPVLDFLKKIGVNLKKFEDPQVFHRDLYPDLGLSRGIFFDKETFKIDKLVPGYPLAMGSDDIAPDRLNGRPIEDFVDDFPISKASKKALKILFKSEEDFIPGKSADEKKEILKQTSYTDYLTDYCLIPEDGIKVFNKITNDFFGLPVDSISGLEAWEAMLPGFDGLKLDETTGGAEAALKESLAEPYIHHFPDGNASITRLIVRSLIPAFAPGSTMEDIVTAPANYLALDQLEAPTKIRLNSSVINMANRNRGVHITYSKKDILTKVFAKKAIFAGYNMMLPYICPELPDKQKKILSSNVKMPLVYTKAVIKSWDSFVKLKVHEILATNSYFCRVKLDYPVSLGDYYFPTTPSEPMCVHMVHVPLSSGSEMNAKDQLRAGRAEILSTSFEEFEKQVRNQLDAMLSPAGFNSSKDLLAITVNRWPHGYSYYGLDLFDNKEKLEETTKKGRFRFGNIAIANSDSAFEPYLHTAVEQGQRAAQEIT